MADNDKKDPNAAPTPESVRRLSSGSLATVQLLLAVLILASANYLAGTHHKTWDFSRDQDFSLSNHTLNLLSSDLLVGRPDPIRITAALRKNSPHYDRLRAVLEEYERHSKDKLRVEFIDPIRDVDRTLELSDAYDHIFLEDIVIVDAIPTQQPTENGAPATGGAADEMTKLRQAHLRFLPVEDMLVYRVDLRRERRLIGYQDEDVLTSSLLSALEGTPRKFYFLADKSQLQDASIDTPYTFLTNTLAKQNIALVPLRLSDIESIPEDAHGVALVAPQYDLDEEREMPILREYWNRPRSALMVILDPAHRPPNLRAFLREHGVTPRNDRVMTVTNGRRLSDVRSTFTFGAQLNRINEDLSGKATVFEGSSSSLEIREGAENLILRGIFPIALIQAADGYWGETRYTEENPAYDSREDSAAPLYLAAAVIRGNETSDEIAGLSSRMTIISNIDFLHPDNQHVEQVDFLRNATNWLIGRESLMGVGPRPVQQYKLNLVPSQISFVNRLNLIILPCALLLAALLAWSTRRA